MSRIVEAALGTDLSGRLQEFVRKIQLENVRRNKRDTVSAERLNDLEADLGFLAMLQVATLRLLDQKGLLKGGELIPHLMLADQIDGSEDGSLSMDSVRNVIGIPRRGGIPKGLAAAAKSAKAKSGGKKSKKART